MADITVDGKTKVSWVPTIVSIAAPTTTELNAGVALAGILTSDGLVGLQADTASIDATSLNSTFDTTQPGRAGWSGTMLRLKKQTATDTAYTTLIRDAAGYLVIRRGSLESVAWAASDKVEVYPAVCGETRILDPEPNSMQRYEVPLFISSQPNLRAVAA